MSFASYKDRKAVATDLKAVPTAVDEPPHPYGFEQAAPLAPATDAFVAMVEECEIRVRLSCFTRETKSSQCEPGQ